MKPPIISLNVIIGFAIKNVKLGMISTFSRSSGVAGKAKAVFWGAYKIISNLFALNPHMKGKFSHEVGIFT